MNILYGLVTLAAQPAQGKDLPTSSLPSLSSWLVSSLLVIGLIIALAWLLKKSRLLTRLGGGQMKVIASLPLGYKEKVVVVQVGQEQWLLGVTPAQINLLARLDTPLSEASSGFNSQLTQMMNQHEQT